MSVGLGDPVHILHVYSLPPPVKVPLRCSASTVSAAARTVPLDFCDFVERMSTQTPTLAPDLLAQPDFPPSATNQGTFGGYQLDAGTPK